MLKQPREYFPNFHILLSEKLGRGFTLRSGKHIVNLDSVRRHLSIVLPVSALYQNAAKRGCGLGGVCRHTKTAKSVKTTKTAKSVLKCLFL